MSRWWDLIIRGIYYCVCVYVFNPGATQPQNWRETAVLSQPVHETATYRCDDTRGCVMQFWPHDDEHMCSKQVEAWNKLIVKQKFCASSWLITEINILRCTVRKTSKQKCIFTSRNTWSQYRPLSVIKYSLIIIWCVNITVLWRAELIKKRVYITCRICVISNSTILVYIRNKSETPVRYWLKLVNS